MIQGAQPMKLILATVEAANLVTFLMSLAIFQENVSQMEMLSSGIVL